MTAAMMMAIGSADIFQGGDMRFEMRSRRDHPNLGGE
jgi:hypothetical protein